MKRDRVRMWNFLLAILCVLLFVVLAYFLIDNQKSEGAEKQGLEQIVKNQQDGTKANTQKKNDSKQDTSTEKTTESTEEESQLKVTGITCWGDEFLKKSDAETYSYPAVLQKMLDENGYDLTVQSKMLGGGSTLSVMKMAGVSDEILDGYVQSHLEEHGSSVAITETGIRDFTEEELERNDQNDIPIIFMGYYGGWNHDVEELIEQQQEILDTFDANKDKFLIVGILPADGNVDASTYTEAMEEKWGEHYISATSAASPNAVASYSGQSNIAETLYEKLVELKYITKE